MFEGGNSKSFFHLSDTCCIYAHRTGGSTRHDTDQRFEAAFQTGCKAQSGETADTRSLPEEQTATAGRSSKQGQRLAIAFIYLSDELVATAELEEKMKIALSRISEKVILMKPHVCRISACWMSLRSIVRKVLSFLLLIPIYFLPGMYFAPYSSLLSVYAYLLGLCGRSHQETRPLQRTLSDCPAHSPVSSVGWFRL